jgi:serine/threonine-protein kinase
VIGQSPLGNARVKAGTTVTLTYSTGPAKTTVPTVAGDTVPVGTAQLRQNGLGVLKVQYQPSTAVPQGQVIGTNPGAGESVVSGKKVVLVVSSGESVPNVLGESYGDAQAALSNFTNAGTQVIPRYQTTTTAQPDTVIGQSPSAGRALPRGGSITLTVAKAPTTVHMQRVVGQTPTAAVSELNNLGLNAYQVPKTTHNPNMVGLVVQQYPTSNMTVKKGTLVTIYVGQAPTGSGGGSGGSGGTGGGGIGGGNATTGPSTTSTTQTTTT